MITDIEESTDPTITDREDLKVGSFYWVQPVPDYLEEEEWEIELQPARYAGAGKWNLLDEEGKTDWPMRYIGDEIVTEVKD